MKNAETHKGSHFMTKAVFFAALIPSALFLRAAEPAGWKGIEPNAEFSVSADSVLRPEGLIESEPFQLSNWESGEVRIRLHAKGKAGLLKIYLLQGFGGEENYKVAAYALERAGDFEGEYVEEFPIRTDMRKLALAVNGRNVEISGLSVTAVEKKTEKQETKPFRIAVPRLKKSPSADGKIESGEWENALVLENPFSVISSGQARFSGEKLRLGSDGENLWVALDSGGGNSAAKPRGRDGDVYLNDSIELYVNPEYGKKAPGHAYQIVADFSGQVFDQDCRVEIGQMEKAWNCEGLCVGGGEKNGIVELKIPFRSIGVDPGKSWGMNICRNDTGKGISSTLNGKAYRDTSSMAEFFLADGFGGGELSFRGEGKKFVFGFHSSGGKAPVFSVAEDGGEHFSSGNASGELLRTPDRKKEDGCFEFDLSGANGEKFLFLKKDSTLRQTDSPAKKRGNLNVEFYPFGKKAAVRLGSLSFSEQKALKKAVFEIENPDGSKQILESHTPVFAGNSGGFSVEFTPSGEGLCRIRATVFRGDGGEVESAEKTFPVKKLSWAGNGIGKERMVVPPFTNLVRKGNAVSLLMRKYVFGRNGFPERIEADGEDVLSAPVELTLETPDGKILPARAEEFLFTEESPDRMVFQSKLSFPEADVRVTGVLEYDGFLRYSLKLEPKGKKEIRRLSLNLPVRDARLLHAVGDGIRNPTSFRDLTTMPESSVAWTSREIRNSVIYGNFLPSVWTGNPKRGITFAAESDKGWINTAKTPCFELSKSGRDATLKVNFIAKKSVLESPREIEFALIANPVKPKAAGCDQTWGRSWQTSFSRTFLNRGLEMLEPGVSKRLFPKGETSFVPYTCGDEYIEGDSEIAFFKDEIFHHLRPGLCWEDAKNRRGGLNELDYYSMSVVWTPELVDFLLWRLDTLMETLPVDGVYLDNSFPNFGANLFVEGQGYFRDDGRFQPVYPMFTEREYLKRVATLAEIRKRRRPRIVVHNTSAVLLGAGFSFADLMFGGEMGIPENQDHYDVFTGVWPEIMLGVNWGVPQGMLTMLGYGERAKRTEPNRALISLFRQYDSAFWNSGMDGNLLSKIREIDGKFGTNAPDSEFVLSVYNTVFVPSAPFRACFYKRPGKYLIYLSNPEKTPGTCVIETGLSGILKNAETEEKIVPGKNGKYSVEMKGRDFRVLEFTEAQK